MDKEINVRLFPEVSEVRNLVNDGEFISKCAVHLKIKGYTISMINEEICIFHEGRSSCQSGTLVGWKYVNDIEKFIKPFVSEWCFSSERNQSEMSAVFAAVSEVATVVSKRILEDEK